MKRIRFVHLREAQKTEGVFINLDVSAIAMS